jgi:hypothetical protein
LHPGSIPGEASTSQSGTDQQPHLQTRESPSVDPALNSSLLVQQFFEARLGDTAEHQLLARNRPGLPHHSAMHLLQLGERQNAWLSFAFGQ